MKKIIIAVAVFVVLGVASIPFFSGMVAEKIVRQGVEDVNAMYAESGLGYSLEILGYDRGFLSSEIDWQLNIGKLQPILKVDNILFKETAQHGFGKVTSTTTFAENPWFADFVANTLEGKNPIDITTEYNLTGVINSTVTVDAFSVKVEDQILSIKPGYLGFTVDKGFKNFHTEMKSEGLAAGEEFVVSDLSLDSDLEMISAYIWTGKMTSKVGNIQMVGPEEGLGPVEIVGYSNDYRLGFDQEKNTVDLEVDYAIDEVNSGETTVPNSSVQFNMKGLDATGVEEFARLYMDLITDLMAQGMFLEEEQDPQVLRQLMEDQVAAKSMQILAASEKFLRQGLELGFSELHVPLPQGTLSGNFTLGLKKDMTFSEFMPLAGQPELLFDIFSFSSDLRLPEALVPATENLAKPIYPGMQTGIFVEDGDFLSFSAEIVDEKLMLNGKEFMLQPLN